jgi:sec-independent protein translocase protein TatA
MIGDVLQPTHLVFLLAIALLVLGPKRLPEVGRGLGRGIRDFRRGLAGADDPAVVSESVPDAPRLTKDVEHRGSEA